MKKWALFWYNVLMDKDMKKLIKPAESVPDFRRPRGNPLHKLSDILIIAFCAIICGAQTYHHLEVFGNTKKIRLSNVDDFARAVRAHWGIENCLHWHLDVTYGEDNSKIRNKNAAGVWNVLRKLALGYLKKQAIGGTSLKTIRKFAGWDSSFLEKSIFTSD